MENKVQKMRFFSRLRIAIFRIEKYGEFLLEKWQIAFIYFIILVMLTSVVSAVFSIYNFSKMFPKGVEYIKSDLPNFTFENDELRFDESVKAYDEEFNFRFIEDTSDDAIAHLKDYKNEFLSDDSGVIMFKNKAYLIVSNNQDESNAIELDYSDSSNMMSFDEIKDKETLVKYLDVIDVKDFIIPVFIEVVLVGFMSNFVLSLIFLFFTIIFGYLASILCGVRIRFTPMFILAVYSSTLSILLSIVYYAVNTTTGFVLKNSELVYRLISYVYMIAAILMIKYDLIKQGEILTKITEMQKKEEKTVEELEEKKEEKEEETKENKEIDKDSNADNGKANDKEEKPNQDKREEKNNDQKESSKGDESSEGDIEGKFLNNEPDGSEI